MPSALIHLLTGRYYAPRAPLPFSVGTVAPDCVSERTAKDHTHLRDSSSRHEDISVLRDSLDLSDPFCLGALLHLYTDMLWDEGPQARHKAAYTGEQWFTDYRVQISLASAWMFRRFEWAPALWRDMLACPAEQISAMPDFPPDAIRAYLTRNLKWHSENDIGPSPDFPPCMVERFCRDTADGFSAWLKK